MRLAFPGLVAFFAVGLTVPIAALSPTLRFLPMAALLLVAGLCIVDGTLGARRARGGVDRRVEPRLSVGAVAQVMLLVRNDTSAHLRLRIRDGVPESLNPDRFESTVDVAARTEAHVEYCIRPDRRGHYLIEGCWVEVPGVLGLVRRTLHLPLTTEVSVIPDVRALRAYDLLARRAMTERAGIRSTRRIGEGTEVEGLRDYVAGDDFRTIDWKATARRIDPVSRILEAERNRNVVFLVDAGRWMGQPVSRLLKLDHALNATLLCAHVAERSGDTTASLVFSDRVLSFLPLGRGKVHQARMLDELHRIPADPVEPDYEAAFRFLAARVRKRSLCILFSDFSDAATASALEDNLAVLARRHLLLCVHVIDPHVEALVGSEAHDLRALNRRAVAERLQRDRHRVLDRVRARGGHVLECRADALTAVAVNRYLEMKGRNLL